MTAHLGGRHLPARRVAAAAIAYSLILVLAAAAGVVGGILSEVF